MNVRRMDPFVSPQKNSRPPAPEQVSYSSRRTEPKITDVLNFKNFKKDDWILLGIIGTLILEGSRDYVLLCALGYLFIMGL